MSQNKETLLYQKTMPATAENQLTLMLESMIHDLRATGSFTVEHTGVYDRAAAITHEDSFVSLALFKGSKGVLS